MLITDFYANREIFITGGTGFLGKALIEKLLRDCPEIKILYILLRGKKSVTAEDRLEDLKKSRVFDRIRKECPQVLNKLHAIEGDSKELGLGIKHKDLELLETVSIIFHMAANVKFDDPLCSSILLNTRGTYELVKIAEKLKNLTVFLHCSTVFCNPFKDTVEERVYKMSCDWRKTIHIAEEVDDYTMNAFSKKFTGHFPNSYTFTKNLSEQIILEYSSKLPMLLFRPSIVLNAFREPIAGWIDNINGPLAGMVGAATGILPMVHGKPDLNLDIVPIDMVTKLTVVAAYKRGMQKLKNETIPDNLEVINCASGGIFSITIEQGIKLFLVATKNNPMENCIWKFDMPILTSCYQHFLFYIFLINIPAAFVVDSLLRLIGKDALLMRISRRVVYTAQAVKFFATKSYNVKNSNMINLENSIPDSELKTFGVLEETHDIDYFKYFENAVSGVKGNILNEPGAASESTKLRYKILSVLNKTVKLIVFILIVKYLLLKLN